MKREDNWTIDERSYRLYDKKYGIPGYFSAICVIWVRYGGNMLVIYFYTYFQVILRVICKQYPGHLQQIYFLQVIYILFMDHYSTSVPRRYAYDDMKSTKI